MVLREIRKDRIDDLSSNKLFDQLSLLVLRMSNEEIERESSILKMTKKELTECKDQILASKKELVFAAREYKRLVALKNVLTKINALKKEGVLVGNNKAKVTKILSNIENKTLGHLRSLEDKLTLYVPSEKVTYY